MSDLTSEALSQIPGYSEAHAAKATIERWGLPTDAPANDLSAYILEAAAAGAEQMPADLLERVAQRQSIPAVMGEARDLIQSAKVNLQSRIDQLIHDDPDPALQHLAQHLAKLVTTVKGASKALPRTITAVAAMSAGGATLKAWQTINTAEQEYDAIRRAQLSVIERVTGPDWVAEKRDRRPWLLRTGLLADHLDSERWWIDRRIEAAGAHLAREVTGEEYWSFPDRYPVPVGKTMGSSPWPGSGAALAGRTSLTAHSQMEEATQARQDWLLPSSILPWPSAVDASSWWPAADHIAYLRWICEHAQPWVPTHQQMIDADTTALDATWVGGRSSSIDPDMLTRAAHALAQHREITAK